MNNTGTKQRNPNHLRAHTRYIYANLHQPLSHIEFTAILGRKLVNGQLDIGAVHQLL